MKQMGFLGPLGTHSEAAAIYLKGMVPEKYELVSCANIYEAIDNLQVVRELIWHVHNNLMMRSDTGEDVPVKRILSHSQPLSQCREFIRCNYPLAEQEAVASTAMAAKLVAEAEPTDGWAAICTRRGGELNGLKLVAENIED